MGTEVLLDGGDVDGSCQRQHQEYTRLLRVKTVGNDKALNIILRLAISGNDAAARSGRAHYDDPSIQKISNSRHQRAWNTAITSARNHYSSGASQT